MKRHYITRMDVAPVCVAQFDKIVGRLGSTHVEVVSRLVKWVSRQDTDIQGAILYREDNASKDLILQSLVQLEPKHEKKTQANSK